MISSLGFGVSSFRFGVKRLGCRGYGAYVAAALTECSVQGYALRNKGSVFRVQGSGFRVQGSGLRVQDAGFRIWGVGCTRRQR